MKNAIARYTIFRRLLCGAFLLGLLWLAPLLALAGIVTPIAPSLRVTARRSNAATRMPKRLMCGI